MEKPFSTSRTHFFSVNKIAAVDCFRDLRTLSEHGAPRSGIFYRSAPTRGRTPLVRYPFTCDPWCFFCFSPQGAELGPRPEVTRGQPMDKWEEFLDPEGRVTDPQRVKELVFRGVRPLVRFLQPFVQRGKRSTVLSCRTI